MITFQQARNAILKFLLEKNDENNAHYTKEAIEKLSQDVTEWYDNEHELDCHKTIKSFMDYVQKDIMDMAETSDERHYNMLYDIIEGNDALE